MGIVIAAIVLAGGLVAAALLFRAGGAGGAAPLVPDTGVAEAVPPAVDRGGQRDAELTRRGERIEALERTLERREAALDRRDADLATRAEELARERAELERLHEEQTRALERAAGMSAAQAKQALLRDVEESARHDAAKVLRAVEEDT